MRIADEEQRDAVIGSYEKEAMEGSDTEEALNAIQYPKGSGESGDPILNAVKEQGLA